MSYDITLKRGDTRNCIRVILKDADGNPLSIPECKEIRFLMAPLGRLAMINRLAYVPDEGSPGEVWHVWALGDTDTSGVYRAEFRVEYMDGRKETFPSNGYISINIMNSLGKEWVKSGA
jgi:hypothetical protein